MSEFLIEGGLSPIAQIYTFDEALETLDHFHDLKKTEMWMELHCGFMYCTFVDLIYYMSITDWWN